MQSRLLFFFLLFVSSVTAQDIRGTWKGKMYTEGSTDSTNIDLVIRSNKKSVLSGSTTQHFDNFNYATAVISINYDSVANTVFLRERTHTDKDISDYTSLTLSEYNLKFEGAGKLTGMVYCFRTFRPRIGFEPPCFGPLHIVLRKQK